MSSGQKTVLILVLAGGFLLASRFISRDKVAQPEASIPNSVPAVVLSSVPSSIPSPVQSEVMQKPTPVQIAKVKSFTPDLDVIRKEVAEDPHNPPKSMMQFAVQMGQRMEDVGSDPEKGKVLFAELDECVRKPASGTSPVIRASCLANAKILGDRIPSLQSDYKALLKATPPSIVKLAE